MKTSGLSDNDDLIIMHGDNEVIRMNMKKFYYEIVNSHHLPLQLIGRVENLNLNMTRDMKMNDIGNILKIADSNKEAITYWIANRVLLLSRKNAEIIYDAIKVPRNDSTYTRFNISLKCRALSVSDNYWIKSAGETLAWKDVDLRRNKLNKSIASVALYGRYISLQGEINSPEFTTNGVYAKAWNRANDGRMWLVKASTKYGDESRREVVCSRLLDKMNVSHCYYKKVNDPELDLCACPSITNSNISIFSGVDS